MSGEVNYKMKHIRQQNIFDDDGNMFPKEDDECVNHKKICESSEQSSCEEVTTCNTSIAFTVEDKKEDVQSTKRKRRKRKLAQSTKRKKRKRKLAELPPEIKNNPKLIKYWIRRYDFFSKFDLGIQLDEESWFSVTPEQVAKDIADRCLCDVIVDAFCGAGGNTIQFALKCKKVIAVDIDPKKVELAKNNADIYGVSDKIEFIIGDFFQLAEGLKADVVFLSPPWGGPSYSNKLSYDLETMLKPAPFSELITAARKITPNIAAYLPRNSNTFMIAKEAGLGGKLEMDENFINKKLIAKTAYFNDLVKEK